MKSMNLILTAIFFFAAISLAEEPSPLVSAAGKYPLSVCPISGETLGEMGDPVVKDYDGREVKFCCGNCVAPFEKDLAVSFEKLNKEIAAAQKTSYPLKTCVVSGEPLGAMGEPYEHMYLNRLVLFCCGGCVEEFDKHADKYLAKIDEASTKEVLKDEKHE